MFFAVFIVCNKGRVLLTMSFSNYIVTTKQSVVIIEYKSLTVVMHQNSIIHLDQELVQYHKSSCCCYCSYSSSAEKPKALSFEVALG